MGDAIGQMLTSAVGIAISPLPLIAVILMLATPKGRANGLAFTAGWIAAIAAVVTVVVLTGSGADAAGDGGPATWTLWLKLALGALFLLLGAKEWKDRPGEGHEAATPGWMKAIDTFTPGKAAGLAVALVIANPKNLVLAIGGAVSIASSTAATGGKTVAAVLMVLIASLCALVPLGVYLTGGEKAAHVLGGWKAWMARHNTAIMTVLFLVLGVKYIGDALGGLTS
ncbi:MULTISPECIES: GAP family protein [unclassified Streptomyces]|uniref:GAP family protein n=1 Tax=unclassified Streptomyces TaxID=2593676 RepID=UPI0035D7B871